MEKISYSHTDISKKILLLLTSLYVCFDLASDLLLYDLAKVTTNLVINSSAFCYTFTYFINDIITELFGIRDGKFTVWLGIFCDWVFIWLVVAIISLPSPTNFESSGCYHIVLDPMIRISLVEVPGILIGRFINIYFLARTKVLLNSRFFWLRSILSSCLGAVVHTILVDFFVWVGITSFSTIISIIFLNSLINIAAILLLSWAPFLIVYFIKNKLGIDEFDYKEKFNPFKL